MKFMILLGDGMADFPLDELDGKTPLDVANTNAMDRLVREGISGQFCPIPEGYPAGSDIGNLSVFGYDPQESFTGRAPLEAANQGIIPRENQLVFRCNLVTLEDGRMRDFTADHISSEEAAELIDALNTSLGDDTLRFIPGVSYRHLCLIEREGAELKILQELRCTPPHDIIAKYYSVYIEALKAVDPVGTVFDRSHGVLSDHAVNRTRVEAGKLPANSVWLWGQGGAPKIELYQERFGITGAVVSAVDLVNGIARCAGFEVLEVPGITGYVDTNYEGKVEAALDALERHDLVYVHVEAPDEAAHEGDAPLKIRAIQDFDQRVVRPCLEAAKERGDVRLLVAPDHVTSITSRTHAGGPVPFAMWGPGIWPNGLEAFSEREAARAGLLYPAGHELIRFLIREREISSAPVS